MRSASVDLPWSMCAMIEKLRMWRVSKAVPVGRRVGDLFRARRRAGSYPRGERVNIGRRRARPRRLWIARELAQPPRELAQRAAAVADPALLLRRELRESAPRL